MTTQSAQHSRPNAVTVSKHALTRYMRWLKENPMALVCVVSFGLGLAFAAVLMGKERGEGAFGLMLGGVLGLIGGIVGGTAFGAVFWALEHIIVLAVRMLGHFFVILGRALARVWKVALALFILALVVWIVGGVLGLLKIGWAAL